MSPVSFEDIEAEARRIVEEARREAERILAEAREKAEALRKAEVPSYVSDDVIREVEAEFNAKVREAERRFKELIDSVVGSYALIGDDVVEWFVGLVAGAEQGG